MDGGRATQAARDAAAERLAAEYVAGALSTDTFEASVATVLSARYREELEGALRAGGGGDDGVQEVVVQREEHSLILGRSSSCERCFDDDAVSRRHALLRVGRNGSWRVIDLDSTNGTWLNEQRVDAPRPVCDGDELRLGQLRLRLRLSG